MSAETLEHGTGHDAGHAGPTDGTYVMVALFLAVLTAIEVGLSYVKGMRPFPELALLTVMVIKFGTVALFFMHLKYDPKLCKRVFTFGVLVATIIYCGALATFHFWLPGFR